ncbi:MAG: M20/M25/M40 family metallo-hydrolase [Parcubacteria group bacterium]|jgi:acetylornithine deacetylase/succinyl-diaminopimelate desuccinylase-like protein
MKKVLKKQNSCGSGDLLGFVKKLIRYQSTVENPREIALCLEVLEKEFGKVFYVKKYQFMKRPILVLSTSRSKDLDVILAGHVDVVPAKDADFIPKEERGKLYGRGTLDMKSAVVACLFAVREYLRDGGNAKVAVIVTSDEELDGLSTKWLAEKKGYRAKLAILPDGGDESELVLKQKGFWQIKVNIKGKSAHASMPWEGNNPLEKGFRLYAKLLSIFPVPTNKGQWKTSIALTKVEGGKTLNQIPDSATFYFDIRYTDESVREKIIGTVNNFLGEGSTVETISQNGALLVDQKNPLILQLKGVIEKELQKKVSFKNECGTSDAIFFAEQGTPAILFRPRGDGMHQDGEWIDIESLGQFQSIVLNFLKSL